MHVKDVKHAVRWLAEEGGPKVGSENLSVLSCVVPSLISQTSKEMGILRILVFCYVFK